MAFGAACCRIQQRASPRPHPRTFPGVLANMDSETCRLWLRAELSRAKRNCLLRAATRVPGVIVLWAVQTTLLTIVLTYFAALALVRLLHFPAAGVYRSMKFKQGMFTCCG